MNLKEMISLVLFEDNPDSYVKSLHDKLLSIEVLKQQNNKKIDYITFNKIRSSIDTKIVYTNTDKTIENADIFSNIVLAQYLKKYPNEKIDKNLIINAAKDYFNSKVIK